MFQLIDIKKKLIEAPDKIIDMLETYNFCHINLRPNEIRFARDEQGGQNISIRLQNNDFVNVNDFARSFRGDIFGYIIQERSITFREVLQQTKKILGLGDDWRPQERRALFGGIYERIYKQSEYTPKTYDESVLDQYQKCGNLLWLQDGISLEAQRFYDVCFDIVENAIIFPWRDCYGSIMAIKSRYNGEPPEGMSKYYYPIGGNISSSFFNYSQCYQHLYNNDVYIFESEKSCMKAWGWGIKNTLAIGSHSLSPTQCKLLLQLQPKTIYLMLDSDLDLSETKKNADLIKNYAKMRSVDIKFWDWRDNLGLGPKSSPVDSDINEWNYILQNEIRNINEIENEITDDEDEI